MEWGKRPLRIPDASSASGEFVKARPMSEPVRKAAGHVPLELDWTEFDEDPTKKATVRPPAFGEAEPETARYQYITGLGQLKALLREAVSLSRQFDAAAFAERAAALGMCTRDRDEPHLYYFIEDKLGNQFRLYVDPDGVVSSGAVVHERRVALDLGNGHIGYLYPLAFQGEERR